MISIFNGSTRGVSQPHQASTFIQVHHAILKHMHGFTASEWMVFTALALHMDQNGYCFPSLDGLSRSTGLSESTVRRALQSLVNVRLDGLRVLSVRFRHDKNGRQTSNGYVLFPDCEEGVKTNTQEGVNSNRVEGFKTDTPINKNQNETESQVTTRSRYKRTKSAIKSPEPNDPGRLIYEAFRSVAFPELDASDFNLAEWAGARHVVYQMHHQKIDPRQVEMATANLIQKWGGNRDIVTIHALWKHWSTATTGRVVPRTEIDPRRQTPQDLGNSAADIFRKVTGAT